MATQGYVTGRRILAVGILALVLLAVGALSVTFTNRAAGQSATPEASAAPEALATASATAEPDVTIQSTPIGTTGCRVNANNPHIATGDPRRAKGFGEIVKYCNERKDYLRMRTVLFKKGNNGDTTWSAVDTKERSCTSCFHTGIGAVRKCENNRDNLFVTKAYAEVRNNGNVTFQSGTSRVDPPVTLNCGGF